jgi:hypothetical protein
MHCLSVVNGLETDLSRFQINCLSSEKIVFVLKSLFHFQRTDGCATALCAILGEIVFSELKLLRCLML